MTVGPLAKPSGVSLRDHRDHVVAEAERLLGLRPDEAPGLPFLARKYARLTGADLALRVRRAAWYHDRGKAHPLWQTACRKDYETYQAWRSAHGLDPDVVDADDYRRFDGDKRWQHEGKRAGHHLTRSGVRHEFDSLRQCDADGLGLSLAERVAIAAHHRKLSAHPRIERRWLTDPHGAAEFAGTWESLHAAGVRAARDDFGVGLDGPLRRRYEVAGVRALLQLADSRASRAEAGRPPAPVGRFAYEWPEGWERRPVQDLALEHADAYDRGELVAVLRAPTGSGKTAASVLWGQRQIERGRADRLVVAMPTRFTATALAAAAGDYVAGAGLYHSSAWLARYGDLDRDDPADREALDLAREEHGLARVLATPLTVTTVDHLLTALAGTREDHQAALFFLAHAAVVLDEVDFYDPFVQANLVVLLDALRALDVPTLLMSATVPDSARRLYGAAAPVADTRDEASGARVLVRHRPVERPEDADEVLGRMVAAGTGLVYANTVERAVRYYDRLRVLAPPDFPVLVYHSRFTEPHKKTVERAVVSALGRDAWAAGAARGVVVLTQIGEMSLNVTAPLMLSDTAPWDRVAQRAGRLARFAELVPYGEIHVADPHRDGALYPAPYGSFDGRAWTAGEPLTQTAARLDALTADGPLPLTPDRLVDEVDALYPEPEAPDARARDNAARLRDMARDNWLILPAGQALNDDAEVEGAWKSRDIPPQATLLVLDRDDLPEDGPLRLPNAAAWFVLEAERGVQVPHYLRERAVKRGWASPFPVALGYDAGEDEWETAYHVTDGYEAPREAGQGSGLGALSVREHEDDPSRVFH